MAVSQEAQRAADAISDELSDRDVQGIALLTAAGTAGALVAQEVAERVLSFLDRPITPSEPQNLAISGLAKIGVAFLAVTVGLMAGLTSGLGLLAVGFGAFGALVSGGVDIWDMLQRGGIPGSAPMQDQHRQAQAPSPTPTQASEPQAATDGGSNSGYAAYGD